MKRRARTTLKLWEKSFLLTFGVFFVILNIAFVIWSVYQFKSAVMKEMEFCRMEAHWIATEVESSTENKAMELEQKRLQEFYNNKKIYIKVLYDGICWIDSLPENMVQTDHNGIIQMQNTPFYCYDSQLDLGNSNQIIDVYYVKNLQEFYEKQYKNLTVTLGIMLLLSGFVGAFLYWAMKKIYRPIRNISHELKTPLTSVMGYTQYLLQTSGLTMEDREFAEQQILREAYYMKDIVNKVLNLDSLKSTEIHKESIAADSLWKELHMQNERIFIESSLETLNCDITLVKVLITNLINNGLQEAASVHIAASADEIIISNSASGITARDVLRLNRGEHIKTNKIKGNGYGVPLCHEITKIHGWKLRYILKDQVLSAHIYLKDG